MSEFTYAEIEVMARRYVEFQGKKPEGLEFEYALHKVSDALETIEMCCGHITFMPLLNPVGGVYGEEKRRNWLTGWLS